MTAPLTPFERALPTELASNGVHSPPGLAVVLDSDLGTVLETTAALQARSLVERQGFDTCQLTDRGRELSSEPLA